RLALPARFGLLPRFGDGHQVMSWISLTDEIRAIRFLLDADDPVPNKTGVKEPGERSGPYNLTAPNPVTNTELTAALHAAFKRPDFSWLRVPAPLLKLGLGEMSTELLNSARVLPARLTEAGFAFEYPTIGSALAAELPRRLAGFLARGGIRLRDLRGSGFRGSGFRGSGFRGSGFRGRRPHLACSGRLAGGGGHAF